jgi:twitching motility protein PilT
MTQTNEALEQALVQRGLVSPYEVRPAAEEARRTARPLWRVLLDRGTVTEQDLIDVGVDLGAAVAEPPAPGPVPSQPGRQGPPPVGQPPARSDPSPMEAWRAGSPSTPTRVPDEVPGHHPAPRPHPDAGTPYAPSGAREPHGPPVAPHAAPPTAPGTESPFGHPPPPAPLYPDSASGPAHAPSEMPGASAFGPEDMPLTEAEPDVESPGETPGEREPNLGEFLLAVIERGASDLHLTTNLPPMIRIHGEITPLEGYRRLKPDDLEEVVYSMLTQRQRETFEANLELDVSYQLPGKGRFRVNVFQQRDSVGTVMRMIPFEIRSPEALGLPGAVKEFANLRRGLVLVTGVTGSGKSTTLAALIDLVNSRRSEHIMTVEDPIEFLHQHKKSVVNQREVGTDTHSFAGALKHVLRQDPDVILVGELRDLETISTALSAAETGHLVFATLHTQDAPQSVDRVIDVFPPHQQEQIRIQLAGTIAGVVSQQLVPRADGMGRAVAAEVLVATPAVRNLIREGKTHQIYTSMQAGAKFGMQVMDQHLAELVKKAVVNYEVALERCHKVEEFNRLVGKA